MSLLIVWWRCAVVGCVNNMYQKAGQTFFILFSNIYSKAAKLGKSCVALKSLGKKSWEIKGDG